MAPDFKESARWLGKASSKGDSDAQYMLARLHAAGLGVAKDTWEALRLLRIAARQGHAGALEELARHGIGLEGAFKDADFMGHWWRTSNLCLSRCW